MREKACISQSLKIWEAAKMQEDFYSLFLLFKIEIFNYINKDRSPVISESV